MLRQSDRNSPNNNQFWKDAKKESNLLTKSIYGEEQLLPKEEPTKGVRSSLQGASEIFQHSKILKPKPTMWLDGAENLPKANNMELCHSSPTSEDIVVCKPQNGKPTSKQRDNDRSSRTH